MTFGLMMWVSLEFAADQPAERRRIFQERAESRRRAIAVYHPGLRDPTMGGLLLLDGNWGEAGLAMASLGETLQQVNFMPTHSVASRQAELAACQGRLDDARLAIETILPAGPATEPGNAYLLPALLCQRAAAGIALDAGDLDAARAWIEAHDRWLAWSEAVLGRAESHLLRSRYCRLMGDVATAWEHARQSLAEASEPRRPLAILAARRQLGELATASGQLDEARRQLSDSLALAEACEAPFERALTLVALAERDIATSDSGAARERLAEARAICEPLEARPTLERIAALEGRIGGPK